jgi:hypothetical protein
MLVMGVNPMLPANYANHDHVISGAENAPSTRSARSTKSCD